MANTLTDLLPDFYEGIDVVSREQTGMILAVNRNSNVERAAMGQTVRVPVTPTASTATNTPGVNAPDTGDAVVDNVSITISKSKHSPIRFNGEETKGLQNAGTFGNIRADRFAQAIRALNNEMEADLWAAGYKGASRAYGTPGTAPFGTANDLSDFAGSARILDENGAPKGDRQLVLGHAAIQNLRGKQSVLFKVNEAGTSDMLREGMTNRVQGFALRHSDPVAVHTKGTATGLDANGGEPVGETSIVLDGGDGGSLLDGDVVTFAGDANKYVVNSGFTAAAGTATIGGPGLVEALADTVEMTVGNSYTPNLAFDRNAIVLATRAPELPEGGDSAEDVQTVVDPMTGIAYEIAHYKQYLQSVYHVRIAWGFQVVASRHVATLMG